MEGNSGDAESAFKKQFILEQEAAEDTYRMLADLGAPDESWADALKFAAEACEHNADPYVTFYTDNWVDPHMYY